MKIEDVENLDDLIVYLAEKEMHEISCDLANNITTDGSKEKNYANRYNEIYDFITKIKKRNIPYFPDFPPVMRDGKEKKIIQWRVEVRSKNGSICHDGITYFETLKEADKYASDYQIIHNGNFKHGEKYLFVSIIPMAAR